MEDTDDLFAGRQKDVDAEIRNSEDSENDLPFTVIGKIEEPSFGLPLSFNEHLIQWYDPKLVPDKSMIDRAVLAIVELIR